VSFERSERTQLAAASTLTGDIAFRNILIHGDAVIDDRVVWDVVQKDLPILDRVLFQNSA
jgi:uncharacterized protein with HEPN domain